MELEEKSKPLPVSSEQGSISETELSKSLLSVQSKNVSEVAADEIENIPINNLHHVLENQPPDEVDRASTPIKSTTIIDDDYEIATVSNLKKFHKLQHGRQKKHRNKVAPAEVADENERPTSAPSNRTRQWLKEINVNRPMTAAPRISFFQPPLTSSEPESENKHDPEGKVIERQVSQKTLTEENQSINTKEPEEQNDFTSSEPAVNETAYIPYDYARAMISRIVNDMNNMKSNQLSAIQKIEEEYAKMEKHTQGQFNDCVSQLQERHKRRIQHYRQVIELLHAEIQTKGSLRSEAIENLKQRNKELALERKKIQQQLSRSTFQFVPSQPDNKSQVDTKKPSEEGDEQEKDKAHETEEKIVEDAKEKEKRISRDASQESLSLAGAAVEAGLLTKQDDEAEEEIPKPESALKQEESKEQKRDEDQEEENEKRESESEEIIEDADTIAPEKEEIDKKEPEDVKKKTKLEKKKSKGAIQKTPDVMSSTEQAQLNKQQTILASKQAKKIKDLEKQLEAVNRKAEQSRKSAKNVDADFESAKSEIANLKKTLAEQKAELARLEDAAGAGAVALQQVPELKEEIKTLTAENQTLITNYNSERVLRKKYYNMVEDMKGKIRVYCRVRPLSKTEKANKNKCAVLVPDEYTVKVEMNRGPSKEFQFDQIFSETASQESVFEDTHSLIQSAVDGYNVCIFAYGQTGSGKTYTMIGDNDQKQPGIAPRAFDRIFELVEKNKKKFTFKISCYMLELYNEKLVDLLCSSKSEPPRLDIKKDNKGMVVVQGTEVLSAESSDELFQIFLKGSTNRHTASTKMNEDSSRSHLVIGVIIESANLTSGAITRGKLSLVDLAGSERAAKTGATAQQLKEANSINKSLSALGDVISALSSEQSFIPYRNNKLTMLMQDSLGGNAKTLMFVNISPADYNSDESAISMTYASRVKLIKNDATKNADSKEVARLKAIIAKLKAGEEIDD